MCALPGCGFGGPSLNNLNIGYRFSYEFSNRDVNQLAWKTRVYELEKCDPGAGSHVLVELR